MQSSIGVAEAEDLVEEEQNVKNVRYFTNCSFFFYNKFYKENPKNYV